MADIGCKFKVLDRFEPPMFTPLRQSKNCDEVKNSEIKLNNVKLRKKFSTGQFDLDLRPIIHRLLVNPSKRGIQVSSNTNVRFLLN